MASITLNKPSGGQLTLSPEDGTSNETVTIPSVGVGKVLQMQYVTQDTEITTTTTMNYNSPLPTVSQGTEVCSINFTPVSDSSTIYVQFTTQARSTPTHNAIFALFEDSTCRSAVAPRHTNGGEAEGVQMLHVAFGNSSTNTRLISVRAGCQPSNGDTLYINGYPRYAGAPQTTMVIMEVAA